MSSKTFLPILLALLLAVIVLTPSVHAQSTSVTIQGSPSHAVLRSNGTAHFTITAQVTYTGYTPPNPVTISIPNVLSVGILYYAGYSSTPTIVNGTASASPDSCDTSLVKQAGINYALCYMTPFSGSGTETVTFNLIVYDAQAQQYHFTAVSAIYNSLETPWSTVTGSANTADFYVTPVSQVILTIATPPLVAVTIDGSVQTPGTVTVTESPGVHTISVPQTVPVTNGTQINFSHWSDGSNQNPRSIDIEDDTTLTPSYVSQYLLTLTDPSATGGGWYDQGSTAQISAPSSEPLPGILGLLGGTQTFQGWYENGNLVSSSYDASITMNSPHTLDTQYSTNTTMPLIIILILVVVIGGGLFAIDVHRRRTIGTTPTSASTTQTVTPPPATAPPVTPPTEKKPRRRRGSGPFCVNCGTKLPKDSKFCNECGTPQP